MIRLEIPIAPVPASRPRVTKTGHAYDTKQYSKFKKDVNYWLAFNYKDEPLADVPLMVRYEFYRDIQSSISKKEHHRRAINAVRPIVKPDLDNYVKAIQDCCTGHLWQDDNLIVDSRSAKYYSETPHIIVEVTKLGD